MNDPAARKRLVWLVAIGGALLVAVLFVSLAAPRSPATTSPTLIPDTASDRGASPQSEVDSGFSVGPSDAVSLAWRLGLVILVIAGSIVALRWWARRMAAPTSSTGFLRIVDTLALGNNRTVHLLALGDRVIAIGATQQQITMLQALTPEEAARVLAAADAPPDALPFGDFAAQLLESLRGHQRPISAPRQTSIASDPSD